MTNGQIVYHSKVGKGTPVNMSLESNEILSDGQWHHLKLQIYQRILRVYIDGEKVGEELDSESIHNFFDPYLTTISLGGLRKEYSSQSGLGVNCKYLLYFFFYDYLRPALHLKLFQNFHSNLIKFPWMYIPDIFRECFKFPLNVSPFLPYFKKILKF